MTRNRRKILIVRLSAVAAVLGVVGWFGFHVLYTLSHLHEAYAAWDTGTLLAAYMKSHNERWLAKWPDLLTVLDSEAGQQILLRGASAADLAYAKSLRNLVAINWRFDPSHPGTERLVTRPDGTKFPVLWEDPNDTVREYLQRRATTRPQDRRAGTAPPISLLRKGPRRVHRWFLVSCFLARRVGVHRAEFVFQRRQNDRSRMVDATASLGE